MANKIGTYGLALLARAHSIPLYVVAPRSTIDRTLPDGSAIPIEERSPDEVRRIGGTLIAPADVPVANPAFDMTPSELVAAIITEAGIARAPYRASLAALCDER
jgi:methylthioribose-1-phosphate isomerase